MTSHKTGTRQEWRAARLELLEAEKELTRRGDELSRRRQELPWVRIDKDYRFETDEGTASLADLFRGRSQLLVYHFMFGPDFSGGCPACSAIADGFNGFTIHLANHDVMLWGVSRAPLQKLQDYKQRMGWSFPWASSSGSDFNYDFDVSLTDEQERAGVFKYNFRELPVWSPPQDMRGPFDAWAATTGTDWATYTREQPGMSAFVLEDGIVYHTYSAYARGLDGLWGMYQWLDRAPRGRNEARGPGDPLNWFRRHDEYHHADGAAIQRRHVRQAAAALAPLTADHRRTGGHPRLRHAGCAADPGHRHRRAVSDDVPGRVDGTQGRSVHPLRHGVRPAGRDRRADRCRRHPGRAGTTISATRRRASPGGSGQ
jgi:predicted dithiol-disulfide oxidoreductase (DUF899 family)